MKTILDFYDNKFSMKDPECFSPKPYSRVDVIVNCDEPLSSTQGELEGKVESFLSEICSPYGLKAKWDHSEEWYEQRRGNDLIPRISKFGMGINFEL